MLIKELENVEENQQQHTQRKNNTRALCVTTGHHWNHHWNKEQPMKYNEFGWQNLLESFFRQASSQHIISAY